MRFVMRRFIVLFCIIGLMVPAFATEPNRDEQFVRIEKAIDAGTAFLVKQQDADGTWRSKTYGLLKDGTSLTPLVLWSLPTTAGCEAANERGRRAVAGWVEIEGHAVRIKTAPQYPVYTAGLSLQILSVNGTRQTQAELVAWSALIHEHQLTDRNGWSTGDSRFGGWGYSHESPKKPDADTPLSPLDEPNVSATVFALEGLLAADPEGRTNIAARRKALSFIERCQNFRETAADGDAKFNDGGFHFLLGDEVRNKPGVAGVDGSGQTRFRSYGSTTADGLRCLILCGVEPDHARVVAARRWLTEHFDDGSHPGNYPSDRKHLQPSLDFYYAASVARALSLAPLDNDEPLGRGRWAVQLAERLIVRQRADGSWSNPAVDVREDDPLIATPLALRALQLCREALQTGQTLAP